MRVTVWSTAQEAAASASRDVRATLSAVSTVHGRDAPGARVVSGLQQWLLMAPVIGDILHQSIYNLRRLSRPFG